jgi:hypothetical protein
MVRDEVRRYTCNKRNMVRRYTCSRRDMVMSYTCNIEVRRYLQ